MLAQEFSAPLKQAVVLVLELGRNPECITGTLRPGDTSRCVWTVCWRVLDAVGLSARRSQLINPAGPPSLLVALRDNKQRAVCSSRHRISLSLLCLGSWTATHCKQTSSLGAPRVLLTTAESALSALQGTRERAATSAQSTYIPTNLPQWDSRNLQVCAAQGGQREQHVSRLSGTTTAWLHCDTSKPSRQNHRSPSPRPGTLAASLGLRRHSRPRQPAPTARPALLPPPAAPAAPPPPPPPRDPARGRLPSSSRRQPRRPQRSSTRSFASRA